MNEKKWFALYTRARWEKKVSEILTRRKIENYCPINKVVKQWSDRRKVVHEPLFTSYVFARVPEFNVASLRQVSGVINPVYWLGRPAVIRDSEIETIREFLAEHINVRLEKTAVSINDRVRILGGPLTELEGQVLSVGNKTVKVSLPSLGYVMQAEVDISNVAVVQHRIPADVDVRYPLYAAR
jgi:transcription antitermination factor NusG